MTKTKSLLLAATFALGACAMTPNGAEHAMDVREAHPITVDQQAIALRVPIDPSANGLDRTQLARIDGFVSAYRTRGHGPLTVTAPVGESDRAAQQTAADVRAALNASGIPYEMMRGASVRANAGDEIVVSFQSYVATGPQCGRATNQTARQLRNVRASNFGCASQANLAAMISDPRDLHVGAAADGAGDGALSRAISTRDAAESEVVTYEAEATE